MNGHLIGYRIRYAQNDGNSYKESIADQTRHTKLIGLSPMTHYRIDVCGYTSAGTGPCIRGMNITGKSRK